MRRRECFSACGAWLAGHMRWEKYSGRCTYLYTLGLLLLCVWSKFTRSQTQDGTKYTNHRRRRRGAREGDRPRALDGTGGPHARRDSAGSCRCLHHRGGPGGGRRLVCGAAMDDAVPGPPRPAGTEAATDARIHHHRPTRRRAVCLAHRRGRAAHRPWHIQAGHHHRRRGPGITGRVPKGWPFAAAGLVRTRPQRQGHIDQRPVVQRRDHGEPARHGAGDPCVPHVRERAACTPPADTEAEHRRVGRAVRRIRQGGMRTPGELARRRDAAGRPGRRQSDAQEPADLQPLPAAPKRIQHRQLVGGRPCDVGRACHEAGDPAVQVGVPAERCGHQRQRIM